MSHYNPLIYNTAVTDFKRARKKAAMQQLLARVTGKSNDLLAYEDIYKQLKAEGSVELGIQEIPLDAIVGSVGRYEDFTRDFMPKHDSNKERWTNVKTAVMDMTGMPPIDVYKVGDVYFVIDGNHRVSVARQLGTKTITAHVTEVKTRVFITPDDDADDVICKVRYAEFLEATDLDVLRPDTDMFMTFCGHFRVMLAQIEAHKQAIETAEGTQIDDDTAVSRWYDEVYLPVIHVIREQGILRYFPKRTEADLYVLLSERRQEITESLGWDVEPDETVSVLASEKQQAGLGGRLLKAVVPPGLVDGPEPGRWRKFQMSRDMDCLFADYLVALSGREEDWHMLDRAIRMAQRENDRLLGLHVVAKKADVDSEKVRAIRTRFQRACLKAGLTGEFAVEVADPAEAIIRRAVWADLVVLGLGYLPEERPLARIGNRTNKIIQRCPRPILIVPNVSKGLANNMLLAYDGSPKADEALFVAAYLTSRWPLSLTVVTVVTDRTNSKTLDRAESYLAEQGVEDVTLVLRERPIADAVLDTAVTHEINMLIMGGFGYRPVKHMVLGSTVDRILREFPHPILICR
ncbi:MAG: universal stress protein [Chloroflexi bacterium]|nr:universal stress protein [Chloroflexota bacterium]